MRRIDKLKKRIVRYLQTKDIEKLNKMFDHTSTVDSIGRDDVCRLAAKIGDIDLVRWAINNGFPCNFKTIATAAYYNKFKLVKELRADGCPWCEFTCAAAATAKNLKMLQWLRSEGCPWDYETVTNTVIQGEIEMFDYLIEAGCPLAWHGTTNNSGELYELAAMHRQFDFLKHVWAKYKHIFGPLTKYIWQPALETGSLFLLNWLKDQGCPWDVNNAVTAGCNGVRLEVLVWTVENGDFLIHNVVRVVAFHCDIESFNYVYKLFLGSDVDDVKEKNRVEKADEFWNLHFFFQDYNKMDIELFDDSDWRLLFELDLSPQPKIEDKVKEYKKHIKKLSKHISRILRTHTSFPSDVIKHVVSLYV